MRAELPLDGTPHNGNENATQCGVVMNMTVRVSSTAPLTVERTVTWTGTRTEPCQSEGVFTPPPSGCRVVQWISYPVDAPAGAAP